MITAAGGISSATFAQEAKIVVKTADDLPRHTYTIVGSATDVLNSEEKFKALLDAVIANCEADLRKYDIQDPTTLQGYYQVLQTGALFNGDYDATLSYADKIKSLEAKDSKKMMSGATIRSYIKARKSGKPVRISMPRSPRNFRTLFPRSHGTKSAIRSSRHARSRE